MAVLTINDNPTITDTVVFTLKTPDANGCFTSNPYKVNKIVIFYVERDFVSGNLKQYDALTYDETKTTLADAAEANACANPTVENIELAKRLRSESDSAVTSSPFYFKEAVPVKTVGNDDYPAWLSTDTDNAFIDLVTEDEDGNPVYGEFTFNWVPEGVREGDYFICWTWTPLIAGDSISSHMKFNLGGNTQVTTSIPTHTTNPLKYPTLLERYTPEMFKYLISNNDRTPDVLEKFNEAIALGFNSLEDLANQIVDLQDANSIHEALLPYLSNFFNLKLKTNDPTRWRGQIKRAVPLFKSKGTKKALREAFSHAGIEMLGLYQLWEIISSYTWQESFLYEGGNLTFTLEKVALELDFDNFNLSLRPKDEEDWIELSSDYVSFETDDGVTTMIWEGSNLSIEPIDLIDGDELLVLYKYAEIPDEDSQTIENYIRTLPLMDQRDIRDQIYPLKNWNVRVIAENDPMFDIVIPERHPYHEDIIYGQVRTEFPYSENIYNMEEYNGSIRNSKLPCDIDRNFIDPCSACLSSNYTIDLEIENLSDDRILEAQEVLNEFTPFHSVLHTFGFLGGINEFVAPPIEEIECLITVTGSEFVLSGEGQNWFNRVMMLVETNGILREDLASSEMVLATTGTAYNDDVVLFCPEVELDNLGITLDGTAKLKILAPSALSGTYLIDNPVGHTIAVSAVSEPITSCNNLFASNKTLNSCAFAFDIKNPVLDGTLCDIEQDNIYILYDETQDFGLLGTQSSLDVEQGHATEAWKVLIPTYDAGTAYTILDIRSDGGLVLVNHGGLPASNVNGVSYTLQQSATNIVTSEGDIGVTKRGRVTVLSASLLPIQNIIKIDNYYQTISGNEYLISGFVAGEEDQFYLAGFDLGDNNGTNLEVEQKLVSQQIGYLNHRGLKLKVSGNLEQDLGIQNGANSLVVVDDGVENNGFKENFILVVDSDSYFITEIDGDNPSGFTTISLSGADYYWKTLGAGGTTVDVSIYQYTKTEDVTVEGPNDLPAHTFRTLDRNGRPVITAEYEDGTVEYLSLPPESGDDEVSSFVQQQEGITYKIEYDDGQIEQGEL